jgi:cobalt-zinc-cadmium efflux system protein
MAREVSNKTSNSTEAAQNNTSLNEHLHSHAAHDHDEQEGHSHKHGGGHAHAHAPVNLGTAFIFGLVLTGGFVILEFGAGIWANSIALISDAGHNLTDALALGLSGWALHMARRAPNNNKTFGYHRTGILAAILNAASLVLISFYILFESVQRIFNPPKVEGVAVIIVASVALVVNLAVAWMLFAWSKDDLNTRSAFLHIIADAAASLGVIVAGILIVFTGWEIVDPLISILIALLILWSSWRILKEAINILLEGIPEGFDMVSLMRDLLKQPNVKDVHDLHVWTIGSGIRALSCHLVLSENYQIQDANSIAQEVHQLLEKKYRIKHATMQLEYKDCIVNDTFCNTPSLKT